jgi:hypothetical protein
MPDPARKTISATEASGLFHASPYVTRWMLYQRFANGVEIDSPADSRMNWGKKLQPLVLAQAAEDLRLEVRPNAEDAYVRAGSIPLGCTRDATIICPDRGPGALETKCVFDYGTWMREWNEGRQPPRHHEIQLQQQMIVGDDKAPYTWGVIAAWVCGEMHYFERKPIDEFWTALIQEAVRFFVDVDEKNEPDPFGAEVELPLLRELFPLIKSERLDLTTHEDAAALLETMIQYKLAAEQKSTAVAESDRLRAKVLAVAKSAEELILPEGVVVRLRNSGKSKRITVFRPEVGGVAPDHFYAG